jgi:uroporphyrinogen-III synthase
MIPLLILRPEPGAGATAKKAEARGLSPIIRSLFAVEARAWDAPDPARFDSVLITSANAVRHGGTAVGRFRHLPAFAVGAATAHAARDAGFANVVEGSGTASDALRALGEAGHSQPIHLAGADRTAYPELTFTVTTRVVYAATPIDVDLPTGHYVALVHSVRAAARFAALCPSPAHVDVIAISMLVADAARPGWRSVHIAADPADNAMLALAATLCDGETTPHGQV